MITINDISDKGNNASMGKRLKYEVGVFHKENDNNEVSEIYAKFKHYADALFYAESIARNNYYYKKIVIRNRY